MLNVTFYSHRDTSTSVFEAVSVTVCTKKFGAQCVHTRSLSEQ